MPGTSRTGLRSVQRHRAAILRRHPVQRPCHKRHFADWRLRIVTLAALPTEAGGTLARKDYAALRRSFHNYPELTCPDFRLAVPMLSSRVCRDENGFGHQDLGPDRDNDRVLRGTA